MCFLPECRENFVKRTEEIVNLRNIKRGAILWIVGLITAQSC
jgi:hypothetical protein